MTVDADARTLWDYHHVGHSLRPADCIFVLGSHDTRVAERGAEVFLAGWAPLIVFSGNLGALTSDIWTRPEAEIFAEVAEGLGVPRERMILEPRSTNTAENVDFSRRLLAERGLHPRRGVAVQKPYMERRTHATFRQRWPELEVVVTSPQHDFEAYPNDAITREDVIHIMVGDFQRLILYADRGWSQRQEIPPEVMAAYGRLVAAGYTGRLVAGG
ncbi:MAG TPA: YdcF family protein [Vicinamibacteria bacterium]|nr:YdcF family protein [Vicinamibacteria bacterium]